MAAAKKECVLYDRYCIECGECNMCDLDKNKICDNCCKCIEENADYIGIDIDDIIIDEGLEEEYDEEAEEGEEEEAIEDFVPNWKYSEPYIVDINKNKDK